jgi:hypothetical protein
MYALYVCLICVPYMYASHVWLICMPYICLTCMPYMYALHVCLTYVPYMYALYICLICMPYIYALYVCLICMPYISGNFNKVLSILVGAASASIYGCVIASIYGCVLYIRQLQQSTVHPGRRRNISHTSIYRGIHPFIEAYIYQATSTKYCPSWSAPQYYYVTSSYILCHIIIHTMSHHQATSTKYCPSWSGPQYFTTRSLFSRPSVSIECVLLLQNVFSYYNISQPALSSPGLW